MRKQMFVFLLLLFITCCATPPEKGQRFTRIAETKPDYSLLYIYRPYEYIGRGVWPEVFFNEIKTVALVNESYTYVYIKPGNYRIRSEKSEFLSGLGNIPGEISIEPNSEYFLLLDRKYQRLGFYNYKAVHERWTLVDKNEAVSEIRRLRFIKPYVDLVEP
ncbi:MAG: DUF2846 domain-containing protein [Syntrophobacteraceae bacterium]